MDFNRDINIDISKIDLITDFYNGKNFLLAMDTNARSLSW